MLLWLEPAYIDMVLVFDGPVAWTEKMTETGLDTTECNWTIGCSYTGSEIFRLPVSLSEDFQENWFKSVATGLRLHIRGYMNQ